MFVKGQFSKDFFSSNEEEGKRSSLTKMSQHQSKDPVVAVVKETDIFAATSIRLLAKRCNGIGDQTPARSSGTLIPALKSNHETGSAMPPVQRQVSVLTMNNNTSNSITTPKGLFNLHSISPNESTTTWKYLGDWVQIQVRKTCHDSTKE